MLAFGLFWSSFGCCFLVHSACVCLGERYWKGHVIGFVFTFCLKITLR